MNHDLFCWFDLRIGRHLNMSVSLPSYYLPRLVVGSYHQFLDIHTAKSRISSLVYENIKCSKISHHLPDSAHMLRILLIAIVVC